MADLHIARGLRLDPDYVPAVRASRKSLGPFLMPAHDHPNPRLLFSGADSRHGSVSARQVRTSSVVLR